MKKLLIILFIIMFSISLIAQDTIKIDTVYIVEEVEPVIINYNYNVPNVHYFMSFGYGLRHDYDYYSYYDYYNPYYYNNYNYYPYYGYYRPYYNNNYWYSRTYNNLRPRGRHYSSSNALGHNRYSSINWVNVKTRNNIITRRVPANNKVTTNKTTTTRRSSINNNKKYISRYKKPIKGSRTTYNNTNLKRSNILTRTKKIQPQKRTVYRRPSSNTRKVYVPSKTPSKSYNRPSRPRTYNAQSRISTTSRKNNVIRSSSKSRR